MSQKSQYKVSKLKKDKTAYSRLKWKYFSDFKWEEGIEIFVRRNNHVREVISYKCVYGRQGVRKLFNPLTKNDIYYRDVKKNKWTWLPMCLIDIQDEV